jgi:hypothetical protein
VTILSEPDGWAIESVSRQGLPSPRGPMSEGLVRYLSAGGSSDLRDLRSGVAGGDAIDDEDLQLSLHVIYELSYRGFDLVDDGLEWDERVVALRRRLERSFELALRRSVESCGLTTHATSVADVLGRFRGPSLSTYMEASGTAEQFREFAIHRSAYQLKEADPHSWAIPRLTGGRKAALIEIQSDEYGRGVPGASHAELFAGVLEALALDSAYGRYVDRLPAVTLATGNLISMLGLQFRLRSALLGHLAAFEMSSVGPMARYLLAAVRLGFDHRVQHFYEVHVQADEHHGALAAEQLVGGDPRADGLDPDETQFGAAALLVVEDRFARHLLHAWAHDRSSLRPAVEVGGGGVTSPSPAMFTPRP